MKNGSRERRAGGRRGAKQYADGTPTLTAREHEIAEEIWAGLKTTEIAKGLKVSPKTVEAHRANMMKKLRTTNTAQLLRRCMELKVLKVR